ncbi:hypothetical protein SELR_pSRC300600 (plasmid) [Selenomonas ruminantium subsp. lactilytica TAM6421]|uniref:Uncharacterized protein n=1 Tax=Selenomonas ruminantium subsp. lactilytica (strain NBRC 103574 / TAM6421) TaxID=927704 RepID=I0GWJ6_SELRL|nr:hypothetical protein [Selenomonas ruminantium]BAL85133.1 hypothetical protein SELR_pSRC300600 [Selenomonas ruminantium subsp. lactilytica TAM6421]
MKYYELIFGNYKENPDWSIVIKGIRKPTVIEANEFCASDVAYYGEVTEVFDISEDDVYTDFHTENIDNWPVFGLDCL